MEAGSARRRLAVRPDEATIEAHGVAAYAAEGIGTFLLVFFICAAISGFWIYILGPVADALLAALGYRALVLSRQTNAIPEEASR